MPLTSLVLTPRCRTNATTIAAATSPGWRSRFRNWPEYEAGLRRRGGPDLMDRGRGPGPLADFWTGWPGSLQGCRLIQTTLMVRMAFRLALRLEGLMASIITLMDLTISAPDHSTISRRAVTLPVIEPDSVPHGRFHLLIGSTGLQVYGVESWLEAKHGAKSHRKWRKLHLAVDADNGMIVAQTLTDQDVATRSISGGAAAGSD